MQSACKLLPAAFRSGLALLAPRVRVGEDRRRARRAPLWHRGWMSPEMVGPAFERFIAALHDPRDAEALSAAVTPDIQVERYTPGERGVITSIAESFEGLAEVQRWLARTPPVVRFTLVGVPVPEAMAPPGAAGAASRAPAADEPHVREGHAHEAHAPAGPEGHVHAAHELHAGDRVVDVDAADAVERRPGWAIEYAITAGEFRNGGIWRALIAADGRIAALSHHPFALPPGV